MAELKVKTLNGADAVFDEDPVAGFDKSLRGGVLLAADQGYDQARQVWNGMIDRRPGLIVQCTGVADVINAVNFPREHSLLVAVRGGAHSVAGVGLR